MVLAAADLVARLALGLPGAFPVLGIVAIVGLPMCLAFMVADAVPWRRDAFIASLLGAVGLPLALQPTWGWVGVVVALLAQVPPLLPRRAR